MITPDTNAGRMTDKIMMEIREELPDLPTPQYNRIWSRVHTTLECEMAKVSTDQLKLNLDVQSLPDQLRTHAQG